MIVGLLCETNDIRRTVQEQDNADRAVGPALEAGTRSATQQRQSSKRRERRDRYTVLPTLPPAMYRVLHIPDRGPAPALTAGTLEAEHFGWATRLSDGQADALRRSPQVGAADALRHQVHFILRSATNDAGHLGYYGLCCARMYDADDPLAFRRRSSPQYSAPNRRSTPLFLTAKTAEERGGMRLIEDHATVAPRMHRVLWQDGSDSIFNCLPGSDERIADWLALMYQSVEDDPDPDMPDGD